MATEIERKFLVRSDAWRTQVERSTHYLQGYRPGGEGASVRVRVAGARAYLNIKTAVLDITRKEYEYPIPADDAREMLETLSVGPWIEKVRHRVPYAGHVWEVDELEGENAGLVVADIELGSLDEPFRRPSWLGREVSEDRRYYNVCLVSHPYRDWT